MAWRTVVQRSAHQTTTKYKPGRYKLPAQYANGIIQGTKINYAVNNVSRDRVHAPWYRIRQAPASPVTERHKLDSQHLAVPTTGLQTTDPTCSLQANTDSATEPPPHNQPADPRWNSGCWSALPVTARTGRGTPPAPQSAPYRPPAMTLTGQIPAVRRHAPGRRKHARETNTRRPRGAGGGGKTAAPGPFGWCCPEVSRQAGHAGDKRGDIERLAT